MTRQFTTHFTFVICFHVLLFFGSWTVVEHVRKSESKNATLIRMIVGKVTHAPAAKLASPRLSARPKNSAAAPQEKVTSTEQENSSALSQAQSMMQADLKTIYKAELRARIEEHKSYPSVSRRMGQTGTVVVAFTLLADGKITNIRLDTPLEFEKLNLAALEAVKKVDRFKPIPKELGETKMDIKVPVKFVNL